jgi:hypothetical protein
MYAVFIMSATLAAFGLLRHLLMGAMWKLTSVFDFTMNKFCYTMEWYSFQSQDKVCF